ncbi:MAG: BTAD domain-containing putative transcriptional regulator [Longimicrobiales bacterium]
MIRLQTFGGAVLLTQRGVPLAGAATQRRTLGLLSILAVAGEAGVSRDKLVGILWPDVDARRARHSLTQALYAARKSLDCADLFEVTEDVRLNGQRLRSDVGDLEAALSAGDDATVVALYRGPFLDGFFFSSLEFERWLTSQRSRLENQVIAALERLVERSERTGDKRSAAQHLRRLAAIRPADSAVAVRLIRLLADTGDRAGAIQHAHAHVRTLREEFELEPDGLVLQLATELRAPRAAPPMMAVVEPPALATDPIEMVTVSRPRRPPEPEPEPNDPPIWAGSHSYADAIDAPPEEAHSARPRRSLASLVLIGVLAVLILLVSQVDLRTAHVSLLNQSLVVAPFRVLGADASLDYLREGMVELLSTRMSDDTSRSMDAGAVIRAWRRTGITSAVDAPRDTVLHMAARLGAERVIVGSVVGTTARAILSASVVGARSGELSAEASVEGPLDSLTTLVDRLAVKLLLAQSGQDEQLPERITPALPALRAFLTGYAPFANGDFAVAADRYGRALRFDSTFALAALRLAFSADRLNDFELQRRALDHAWRLRDGLSVRDRAHLTALMGARYPAAATRSETIDAWEAAARAAPNRPEVWFGFASAVALNGESVLLGNDLEKANAALGRALELDPNYVAARMLQARITERAATLALESNPALTLAADSLPSLTPFLRWKAATAMADTVRLARLADSLAHFGPANLRAIALASQFDGVRLPDGALALRALVARAANSEQAMDLLLAEHSLALNRGRPSAALEATRRMQRLSPATRAHLRLRVLDAVFSDGDAHAATLAANELARSLRTLRLPSASADACALGHWQLARADTDDAAETLDRIRSAHQFAAMPVGAPHPICADLLDAALAVATERDGARVLIDRLNTQMLTTAAAGDVATYAHIVLARLYRALDEPQLALAAVRRRPYMTAAWPRYLATALREEGQIAEELGDDEGAVRAYQRYLALRASPEIKLHADARAVRALQAAVETEQAESRRRALGRGPDKAPKQRQ